MELNEYEFKLKITLPYKLNEEDEECIKNFFDYGGNFHEFIIELLEDNHDINAEGDSVKTELVEMGLNT